MKRTILIFSLILCMAMPMRAQVFILEEEDNEFRNVFGNGEWNNVIGHGNGNDQTNYLPLGNGLFVITALGGVYLWGKRKEETIRKKKKQ